MAIEEYQVIDRSNRAANAATDATEVTVAAANRAADERARIRTRARTPDAGEKTRGNRMTLEVPDFVTLTDGSSVRVVRVVANVVHATLLDVVYTVEKDSGAWSDVSRDDVRQQDSPRKAP